MQPDPVTDDHRWLARLVGTWTFEGKAQCGDEEHHWSGREVVRPVGDLWIHAVMTSRFEGMDDPMEAQTTLGVSRTTGRIIGTFIASSSAYLWLYDGSREGDTLRLDCDGPSMADSTQMASYRDVIELVSPDERRMTSHMQGEDGTWQAFMETVYRREQ